MRGVRPCALLFIMPFSNLLTRRRNLLALLILKVDPCHQRGCLVWPNERRQFLVTDGNPLFFRVDEVVPGRATSQPAEGPLSRLIGFVNLSQEPGNFSFCHDRPSFLCYEGEWCDNS